MSYESSLNRESLVSAIENLKEYERNLAAQEEKKKEREAQAQLENQENNNENNPEDAVKNENPQEEEKVELQHYKRLHRKLILGIDTLGQDRVLTEEEKNFLFLTVSVLKNSWRHLEYNLLIKDRDLKIKMDEVDRVLKETFPVEKLENDEAQFIKEYFNQEKFIDNQLDERSKSIETDYARAKFILESFFNNESISKTYKDFSHLEFVEYERLFQNVFYFVGVSNIDINEESTNKLN